MLADAGVTGQVSDAAFAFRSDRLALDFAATRMFREPPQHAKELLTDPQWLARWAVAAGLLSAAPSDLASASLGQALEVREAIYGLACALIDGEPLPANGLATLNAHAVNAPITAKLHADGTLVRSGSLEQAVASIARDAVELFGGTEATRVRQCARAGCSRLFVDRTRAHTRVWCGMRECGNRINAAAYRQRRASRA